MKNIIILYLCLGICVKLIDAAYSSDGASIGDVSTATARSEGSPEQGSVASHTSKTPTNVHVPEIPQEPNEKFPNTAKITHTLDAATIAGIVITDFFPEVVIYNLLADLGKFNSPDLLQTFEVMAELATDLFIEYKILQGEFLDKMMDVVDSIETDDDITNRLLKADVKGDEDLEKGNENAKTFNAAASSCFEKARDKISPDAATIIGGIRMLSHIIGLAMEERDPTANSPESTKFKFYKSKLEALEEAMKQDNANIKQRKNVKETMSTFDTCVGEAKKILDRDLKSLISTYDNKRTK